MSSQVGNKPEDVFSRRSNYVASGNDETSLVWLNCIGYTMFLKAKKNQKIALVLSILGMHF